MSSTANGGGGIGSYDGHFLERLIDIAALTGPFETVGALTLDLHEHFAFRLGELWNIRDIDVGIFFFHRFGIHRAAGLQFGRSPEIRAGRANRSGQSQGEDREYKEAFHRTRFSAPPLGCQSFCRGTFGDMVLIRFFDVFPQKLPFFRANRLNRQAGIVEEDHALETWNRFDFGQG